MSQRLFATGKIGVFVENYGPGVEKRSGESVGIVTMVCKVQPFDAKHASSVDEGVGGDSNIRPTIFNLNDTEPKKHFTRHDFKLSLERQNLEIFASPDTETSRVSLNQCKISGCYVRAQKDTNSLAFVFKASFGPVSRDELELIHASHRKQIFVTFHEGEPIFNVEEVEEDGSDADGAPRDVIDGRPVQFPGATPAPPMWEDTPAEGATTEAGEDVAAEKPERANRKLHTGRKGKKATRSRGAASA